MTDEVEDQGGGEETPQNDLLTVLLVISFVFLCGGVFFVGRELNESYGVTFGFLSASSK